MFETLRGWPFLVKFSFRKDQKRKTLTVSVSKFYKRLTVTRWIFLWRLISLIVKKSALQNSTGIERWLKNKLFCGEIFVRWYKVRRDSAPWAIVVLAQIYCYWWTLALRLDTFTYFKLFRGNGLCLLLCVWSRPCLFIAILSETDYVKASFAVLPEAVATHY